MSFDEYVNEYMDKCPYLEDCKKDGMAGISCKSCFKGNIQRVEVFLENKTNKICIDYLKEIKENG